MVWGVSNRVGGAANWVGGGAKLGWGGAEWSGGGAKMEWGGAKMRYGGAPKGKFSICTPPGREFPQGGGAKVLGTTRDPFFLKPARHCQRCTLTPATISV